LPLYEHRLPCSTRAIYVAYLRIVHLTHLHRLTSAFCLRDRRKQRGKDSCAPLKRRTMFHREAQAVVTTPTHLRSIVDHDGAVILDISRDQFFSMNAVAAYIWTRLLKGEGLDTIAKALAAETGTDISTVMLDVNDFVADLKSKHLFHFLHDESNSAGREVVR
jgi:hypothetical protein